MKEQLFTPKEVANLLKLKPRTVTRWCRDGKIEAFKIGRVWRIPESSLRVIQ